MEKNTETGKMTSDSILLLSILAELNEPLRFFHYGLTKGLCLLTDEPCQTDRLLSALGQLNDAEILHSPKTGRLTLPNYKLAVYPFKKYDNAEIINDFLTLPKFLTAIIACGIIPDNFPDTYTLFLPAGSFSHQAIEDLNHTLCEVKHYLRENPGNMEEELQMFATSSDYINHSSESPFYIQLIIAAKMCCLWYRSCHTECETRNYYTSLLQSVKNIFCLTENRLANIDLSDIVIKLFTDYAESHSEICFSHSEDVNGRAYKFLQEDLAIFFDYDYYYLPEKLFKKICHPLLKSFSWPQIKENLRLSGILHCNDCQSKNYTCKKILMTCYGLETRHRFIWLKKKYFTSPDRLTAEERSM